MTPRRRVPKRASPASASKPSSASYENDHFTAVILEEMRSQNRAVIELVQGCSTKTEMAELRGDVGDLEGGLADVRDGLADVRDGLADVREGLAALAVTVHASKRELASFRAEVSQRFDVLTAEVARKAEGAALGALERRVTALEQRVS